MPSQSTDGRPREHQSFTLRGSCSLPVVAFFNKRNTLMIMGMLWRHISDATRQARWPSLAVITMMPPRARRQTNGRGLIRRMLPNLLLLLLLPACSGALTPGWYIGNASKSCVDTCADEGGSCTDEQLLAHNSDVDTSDKLKKLITSLGGNLTVEPCEERDWRASPRFKADECHYPPTVSASSSHTSACICAAEIMRPCGIRMHELSRCAPTVGRRAQPTRPAAIRCPRGQTSIACATATYFHHHLRHHCRRQWCVLKAWTPSSSSTLRPPTHPASTAGAGARPMPRVRQPTPAAAQ